MSETHQSPSLPRDVQKLIVASVVSTEAEKAELSQQKAISDDERIKNTYTSATQLLKNTNSVYRMFPETVREHAIWERLSDDYQWVSVGGKNLKPNYYDMVQEATDLYTSMRQ